MDRAAPSTSGSGASAAPRRPGEHAPQVLVYQLGSIGDTLVSLPALRAVRAHYGRNARLTLLHEDRGGIAACPADVLGTGRDVDRFATYQPLDGRTVRNLARMLRLAWRLRHARFDAVVYLAPSQRTPARVARDLWFFSCLVGIPERVGFIAFDESEVNPLEPGGRPARTPHEAWFRLERLRRTGIPASDDDQASDGPMLVVQAPWQDQADRWLEARRTRHGAPLVAICPGSKQPANLWPIDRFAEIGHRLIARLGVEVIVIGGPGDRGAGASLVRAWSSGLDATGQFPVMGTAGLIKRCRLLVGLDTGTTHLAAALGVPCVALYGERENPGRWEPLGHGHTVIRARVPCAGCRLEERPCPVDGHPCMSSITVEQVWAAVEQAVLPSSAGRSGGGI